MFHADTWKERIRLFLVVMGPILVTQVGFFAMSLIDTMMSGRAGVDDLAGVAVGSSLWMPVFLGFNGILLAVTPIVAQLMGSGRKEEIAESVTQAFYLAILLAGFVLLAGGFALEPVLGLMDLEAGVHHIAKHYLIGLSIGVIPLFIAHVLRYFFDSQGYPRITMVITLLALPVNFLLNLFLIFGYAGFPELGGIGAGYATALTYWLLAGISVWMTFTNEIMRRYRLFVRWFKPSVKAWKMQLAIGIPIGLSLFFEVSIFSVVTILVASMFDKITLAAHQAALNFTSMIFMVPLSISMALTIVVAYSVGGKRYDNAQKYTVFGTLSAICILFVCSFFLYFFRLTIASFYSADPAVLVMTGQFIVFAIFYQFSDAVQASLQGVLRGYKDVTLPFVIALISYWGIGFPTGYLLAAFTSLEAYGFWVGITAGLTAAACGFFFRLVIVRKKQEKVASHEKEAGTPQTE
ncbi:MATE family efflux transporter [Bacillus piscicola]|uniref:MATE family efflux transporter n=1 Tax=Bacillus piscicola TaxID=1632684 RepID=UPI001F09664F|nr:MATE family efflux transporter [Bacillus piscicola]